MKVEIYDALMRRQASRRDVLRGTASAAALMGVASMTGGIPGMAFAADDLRAQILKIPGVGKGAPTDADWQKVGELCLEPTKANVAAGEFAGVELTFMGLNNQNLHNFLFRGFLKPWEAYTGAKINWIDLAQADYNARLQQSIATGTVARIGASGAGFITTACVRARTRAAAATVALAGDGRLLIAHASVEDAERRIELPIDFGHALGRREHASSDRAAAPGASPASTDACRVSARAPASAPQRAASARSPAP